MSWDTIVTIAESNVQLTYVISWYGQRQYVPKYGYAPTAATVCSLQHVRESGNKTELHHYETNREQPARWRESEDETAH